MQTRMHRHSVGCQCVSVEDTEKYNLYRFVDVAGCRALNVRDAASAVHPFKPESQKRDRTTWCETDLDEDDDEERLVLHAPFVGTVRLRRLVFVGAPPPPSRRVTLIPFGRAAEGGARVAVYKNSPADWTTLDGSPATQSFDLVDVDDRELTVVAPRFNDVRSLTFVFAEVLRFGARGGFARRHVSRRTWCSERACITWACWGSGSSPRALP